MKGTRRTRTMIGTATGLVAASVALFGGLGQSADLPPVPAVSPQAAAESAAAGFSRDDTARTIATLEARVAARPRDARALTLLGLAYHQRSRETGAPELYVRAEDALRRALRVAPRDAVALFGLAGVSASRHDFREALRLANRAHAVRPEWAAPFGIIGDANLELGRYRAAFAAFDRQAALRPSASAYARVSYARELLNDFGGAVDAMTLAVDAAAPQGEAAAWARTNVGNLYLGRGKLRAAERWYREALLFVADYPAALAGLGQISEARGALKPATALYRRASRSAVPEYAVLLGDVLARRGDGAGAEAAWARAARLEQRFAAAGGNNHLERALFDLDHDRNVAEALRLAREGRKLRPSIEGDHVLAWALYKNGRCGEARIASIRALRLGTPDLDALYHRSLIERCLGNSGEAAAFLDRVRALDPYYLAAPPSPRRFPAGT